MFSFGSAMVTSSGYTLTDTQDGGDDIFFGLELWTSGFSVLGSIRT